MKRNTEIKSGQLSIIRYNKSQGLEEDFMILGGGGDFFFARETLENILASHLFHHFYRGAKKFTWFD